MADEKTDCIHWWGMVFFSFSFLICYSFFSFSFFPWYNLWLRVVWKMDVYGNMSHILGIILICLKLLNGWCWCRENVDSRWHSCRLWELCVQLCCSLYIESQIINISILRYNDPVNSSDLSCHLLWEPLWYTGCLTWSNSACLILFCPRIPIMTFLQLIG